MSIIADLSDPTRVALANLAAGVAPPPDATFDQIAETAATVLVAPLGVVTVVRELRVRAVGSFGLPPDWADVDVGDSLCSFVTAQATPMVFTRPAATALLRRCLPAQELGYYAGHPIEVAGHVIGAVAIADRRTREDLEDLGDDAVVARLRPLAAQAAGEIGRRMPAD